MPPRRVKQKVPADDVFASIFYVFFFVRLANALSIKTFFQPDEYFQSLEPALERAFGWNVGAWITWVFSFVSSFDSRSLS
jgi:hypothetical protein